MKTLIFSIRTNILPWKLAETHSEVNTFNTHSKPFYKTFRIVDKKFSNIGTPSGIKKFLIIHNVKTTNDEQIPTRIGPRNVRLKSKKMKEKFIHKYNQFSTSLSPNISPKRRWWLNYYISKRTWKRFKLTTSVVRKILLIFFVHRSIRSNDVLVSTGSRRRRGNVRVQSDERGVSILRE